MISDEAQLLLAALARRETFTELLVLAFCLALAWLIVRVLRGRARPDASIWFGDRIVDGVLFPVLALVLAYASVRMFYRVTPGALVPVFRFAVPILLTLVVVRVSGRVLDATFASAGWVRMLESSIAWLAWISVALWLTGILPYLLDGMESIQFTLGDDRITLRNLLEGALSAGVVIVVALWISAAIERKLIHGTGNDLSVRKMASNIVRAVLVTVGLLVALSAVGIDLTALSVLGGALGVGLGFGLQRIAANYVSGFVMLAERTVRVGDMVKVDGFEGRVSDIRARYTVLRAITGRESIVPNEMFMSQRVENLSFTDTRMLVQGAVTVAYGTDVVKLRDTLRAVMLGVPRVLAEPGPAVHIGNFGLNGIDLLLNFWIADPENGQGNVRSDVHFAVLASLDAEGVEIPRQFIVHGATDASAAAAVQAPQAGPSPTV
ncbi:mechanosensitive ion channel [soil metagenome]